MEPKYKPNDPQLIENILAELKRSGMFDQFRKDCISDVDTKPAYQNLQFKVENTVTKFLSSQKWSPDTNRNQLREKLRKNILDSGYLDSGIERIVDQVLYPKMAGFQSQIEELVYSYLNIDRPKRKVIKEEPVKEEFNTSSLLPKDLEAVSSPESEKHKSFGSQEDLDKQLDEQDDDFESPAFEPLEGVVVETAVVKKEDDDSHLSGLSNMKSEGSVSDENSQKEVQQPQALTFDRSMESIKHEEDESQLSRVSSGSRLSIVVQSEKDSLSPKPEVLNITEEAQMPKFSENSNSIDSKGPQSKQTVEGQSLFDFKKEEIEFKGPCRKQMTLDEKLKEEIYESENKHANIFKTDEIETNSHSSDMKLEIVEHNITESESRLKIDVEVGGTSDTVGAKAEEDPSLPPPKAEVSENEGKVEDKEKHSSSSDKKDRGSHHKVSKSSKHSSKDKDRDEKRSSSKHSSSHHSTSKSRHSDKDRHHSSSSRHKSSSSSKNKDRHSSGSGKDKDKSSSKDRSRDHRSRSDHKSKDEKKFEEDEKRSPIKNLSQEYDEVFEDIVEDIGKREHMSIHMSTQEFIEPNPLEVYSELPCQTAAAESSPVKNIKEASLESPPKLESPNFDEITPKASAKSSSQTTPESLPTLYKAPSLHDFMSDEDDFYGFPENEMPGSSTPYTAFMTPAKIPAASDVTQPGTSSQKSILNRSLMDEELFYGFSNDDATPKKPSSSTSTVPEIIKLPELQKCSEEKPEDKGTGNGKRVRRPNTKYLSDEFTTNDDDDQELEEMARSSKKRKRMSLDIVKIMKKQKSEDKSVVEETQHEEKSIKDIGMPVLTPQSEDIPSEGTNQPVKGPISPKTPEKQDDFSEGPSRSSKSSKKHSKHDRRSSSRRK